jgi:hypothetical protein
VYSSGRLLIINSHVLKLLLLLLHYYRLIINYFSMLKYYHKSHLLTISAQSLSRRDSEEEDGHE